MFTGLLIAIGCAIIALIYGVFSISWILAKPAGNARMQEIAAAMDAPDDIAFDLVQDAAFPDQSVGRSILGTVESVSSFKRTHLGSYLSAHYHAPNMVLAAAGAVDHAAMGHAAPSPANATAPLVDHAAMGHGASFPEGAQRALLQLRVRERVAYSAPVPAQLSSIAPIKIDDTPERPLRLGFAKGRWRINDRVFAMGETPIEVKRDTVETWLIRNYFNSMPHAMHLHGFHFQVLERQTSPDQLAALKVDGGGRLATDLGWKDTVLVWPGESVRVAIDFHMPFAGEQTYMVHCHNLEHEDGGMMLGMKVT
jgi:FtsP/CotA-like multicopper oxidase with cupredoxin domain